MFDGDTPQPGLREFRIMAALGLGTTAELIRYAIEHGLTTSLRPN